MAVEPQGIEKQSKKKRKINNKKTNKCEHHLLSKMCKKNEFFINFKNKEKVTILNMFSLLNLFNLFFVLLIY